MIVTRFAPSPTGRLHLGHVYAAKFAHDMAKNSGGSFLLRIEDIDTSRCRAEYIDGICEDLEWLGLKWDGKPRLQSNHMDEYADALNILKEKGVLYPCVCTRKEIDAEKLRLGQAPHAGESFVYPGFCREKGIDINEHQNYAWRLDVSKALKLLDDSLSFFDVNKGKVVVRPDIFGDVVLARKEFMTSYHLSSVYDDALQGVTLVTRGEDLFESTHIHCLLQKLLGYPTPCYTHHPLVLDENGQRFAKRNRSVTIQSLREKGCNPQDIFDFFTASEKNEKSVINLLTE